MFYRFTMSMSALFGVVFASIAAIMSGKQCIVGLICAAAGTCCERGDRPDAGLNATACCCCAAAEQAPTLPALECSCEPAATADACCSPLAATSGPFCPCQCCRPEAPKSAPADPRPRLNVTDESAPIAPLAPRFVRCDDAGEPSLARIAETSTRAQGIPVRILFCVWTE